MTIYEQLLSEAESFKVFIDNVMKLSTYTPVWNKYIPEWEFFPTLNFKSYTGKTGAAMVGSVINFSSDKPLMERPTLGSVSGDIPTMGDRWQLDKRQVRQLLELEDMVKAGRMGVDEIYSYLFNDYEAAAIVGMKRLDYMTLQGMSTGKITMDNTNNPDGVTFDIDLSVKKETTDTGVSWATTATAKPLDDIYAVVNYGRSIGIRYESMKMSRATFNKMIATDQFSSLFGLEIQKSATKKVVISNVARITLEDMNTYLTSVALPIIEIVEDIVRLKTGVGVYPFADDNVTFVVADNLGTMAWSFVNEERVQDANKVYAKADKTLISTYNKDGQRFVEYELNAIPAFSNTQWMYILDTTS